MADRTPAGLFQELWGEAFEAVGEGCLGITGDCMLPTLAPGDRVWVEKLRPTRYRVGDVAICEQGSTLIAHRLVGAFGWAGVSYLLHKGDRNRGWEVVPRDRVLARVVAVLRPDGTRIPVPAVPPPPLRRIRYSATAFLRRAARELLRPGP